MYRYPLYRGEPYIAVRGNEHVIQYLQRLLAIGVITNVEYEHLRYALDA